MLPDESPCRRQGWLLDKALHDKRRVQFGSYRPVFYDVAVTGFRVIGLDSDRDQLIGSSGQLDRTFQCFSKRTDIGDPVIGGKDDHHRFGITAHHFQSRQADARSGILALRLGDKVTSRYTRQFAPEQRQLIGDRDDQRLLATRQWIDAFSSFSDQTVSTKKLERLLRSVGTAQRPEARTFPARDDHVETNFTHWIALLMRSRGIVR